MHRIIKALLLGISLLGGMSFSSEEKKVAELRYITLNSNEISQNENVADSLRPMRARYTRRCIMCHVLVGTLFAALGTCPLWFKPLFPEVKNGKRLSAVLNYEPDQECVESDICVQVNIKQFDGLGQTTCVSNSTNISNIANSINAQCLGNICKVTAIARVQCNDDARTRRCDSRLLQVAQKRNSVQLYNRKQKSR